MNRFRPAAALLMVAWGARLSAQTITLDSFDADTATGSVVVSPIPSTWAGNVTQNSDSITVGGAARDDNGWSATEVAIDASAMTYLRITGRVDAGNAAPALVVQFEDSQLNTQLFAVNTAAFTADGFTQVQIPVSGWNLAAADIASWSIGGGTPGLVTFRLTLAELSLSSALIPLSGGGRIVTAGNQVYAGAVALGAATILGHTGSNGNAITFNGTVDGAQALTLETGGVTTFGGAVGGTTALASLTTDAGGSTVVGGGQVVTTGAQTFNDAVNLGADTWLRSTAGSVNLLGGINGNGHSLTLEIAAASVFQGASDLAALTKAGAGMLTITGLTSVSGNVAINAGMLELGLDHALMSENALLLGGGTLASGGYDQNFGLLTVSGDSAIDFGSGFSALTFADSRSVAWTGALSIENFTFGEDTLRFGTSVGALTASQLAAINFGAGLVASIDANGFVTGISAVPEPAAFAMVAGCLTLAGAIRWRSGRRRPGVPAPIVSPASGP